MLHNLLFLNEKKFSLENAFFPLCSFCNCQNENMVYLFSKCVKVNSLWTEITLFLQIREADTYNFIDCLFGLFK